MHECSPPTRSCIQPHSAISPPTDTQTNVSIGVMSPVPLVVGARKKKRHRPTHSARFRMRVYLSRQAIASRVSRPIRRGGSICLSLLTAPRVPHTQKPPRRFLLSPSTPFIPLSPIASPPFCPAHARRASSVLPVPHLLQELLHADLLAAHLHHPRVFEHAPRRRAAGGFLLETAVHDISPGLPQTSPHKFQNQSLPTPRHKRSEGGNATYQHSMKYLKLALHLIAGSDPHAGSSFSFGSGWPTMYWMMSMRPAARG